MDSAGWLKQRKCTLLSFFPALSFSPLFLSPVFCFFSFGLLSLCYPAVITGTLQTLSTKCKKKKKGNCDDDERSKEIKMFWGQWWKGSGHLYRQLSSPVRNWPFSVFLSSQPGKKMWLGLFHLKYSSEENNRFCLSLSAMLVAVSSENVCVCVRMRACVYACVCKYYMSGVVTGGLSELLEASLGMIYNFFFSLK